MYVRRKTTPQYHRMYDRLLAYMRKETIPHHWPNQYNNGLVHIDRQTPLIRGSKRG